MSYSYSGYGLNIESEFQINALEKGESGSYDISIKSFEVTEKEVRLLDENRWYYIGQDLFYIHIDTVGYYKITQDGILVDAIEGYSKRDFEVYLLGTAFGLAMFLKNILSIHGGCVVLERDSSIIITGDRGAGKSSLIDFFVKNGHNFLTDDVARIKFEMEKPIVCSAYSQRRLCGDFIKKSEYKKEDFELRSEERDKYAIDDFRNYRQKEIALAGIVELKVADKMGIEELKGIEKVKLILNNIYRIEFFKYEIEKEGYFRQVLDIAQSIKAFRIYRPKDILSMDQQRELILAAFKN